jgi:hypothetical protein
MPENRHFIRSLLLAYALADAPIASRTIPTVSRLVSNEAVLLTDRWVLLLWHRGFVIVNVDDVQEVIGG